MDGTVDTPIYHDLQTVTLRIIQRYLNDVMSHNAECINTSLFLVENCRFCDTFRLLTTGEAAWYIILVVSVCLSVCLSVCQTITF